MLTPATSGFLESCDHPLMLASCRAPVRNVLEVRHDEVDIASQSKHRCLTRGRRLVILAASFPHSSHGIPVIVCSADMNRRIMVTSGAFCALNTSTLRVSASEVKREQGSGRPRRLSMVAAKPVPLNLRRIVVLW